ncbi:autotransporter outer membrane beta-barrel domain-containing protein [Xenorhabdus sp. 12]|uniref:Autotransporter outer membrane beta-barrel domain-containing protein n=1 Tax=Xenorhabdus santafensis TaxID=2582833 RepID=A0ABU4S825_9GAMM|nr:Ail/Lom family outer membrane beta-barrel protein [Xenorhabdus sp. 12]MDX7986924.1 autotransporter outer membrane beta-barrel domain-containing protein [Xenorhabdus sp. 12]
MKKAFLATLVVSGFMYVSLAYADSHTVAVGYAQSKVQNFKNIRGVNLHYRYEWDSPVSIIGSFTYMKGSENHSGKRKYEAIEGAYYSARGHLDGKYYSLMAGPAYRINDYVSIYGLIGFAHTKIDADIKDMFTNKHGPIKSRHVKVDKKSTDFAYGAGVEVNPMPNLSVYAGYEGSSAKLVDNGSHSINGFNIGLGYRF